MNVEQTTIPKKFHDAVLHWQRHNFPDYDLLPQNWEKYFEVGWDKPDDDLPAAVLDVLDRLEGKKK